MSEDGAFQSRARETSNDGLIPAKCFRYLVEQAFGDDRQALGRINDNVFELRIEADGKVRWNGPRRCRPDQAVNLAPCQAWIQIGRVRGQPETNVDGCAGVVLVFNFGFGKSCAVLDAPV